ncbi:CYTH domain-containing protein [Fibrisoma montanum]|uniref:CYTH domain-containing protein n=2 Tax=Fibrisoma montanum TaxID=2305895 RepID=A0A418M4N3_9BACT|nr:CYTH domain-containing protein [Fibrisoma montanum]
MGMEIERKFLVNGTDWKQEVSGLFYRQGYLSSQPDRTVRVRTVEDKGYLTIKGKTSGASRSEYEYVIPYEDAVAMLDQLCETPIIEKVRYRIPYEGLVWEIDEFQGENLGLIVAEVELTDEKQAIQLPPWVGKEVTTEAKYYNANLFKHPFSKWID